MGRESIYSHPPSYRSREGSISQNPDAGSVHTNLNPSAAVHSRDPSCLSFLSHDSLYSTNSHDSRNRTRNADGSISGSGIGSLRVNKDLAEVPGEEVLIAGTNKKDGEVLIAGTSNNVSVHNSNKKNSSSNAATTALSKRDGNTVTIVQTTDSSQVIGSQSVIVTVSGNESENPVNRRLQQTPRRQQQPRDSGVATSTATDTEISVLAHL